MMSALACRGKQWGGFEGSPGSTGLVSVLHRDAELPSFSSFLAAWNIPDFSYCVRRDPVTLRGGLK